MYANFSVFESMKSKDKMIMLIYIMCIVTELLFFIYFYPWAREVKAHKGMKQNKTKISIDASIKSLDINYSLFNVKIWSWH